MNKLEKILGINFPKGLKISNVTNSTDKVVDGSIFFGTTYSERNWWG